MKTAEPAYKADVMRKDVITKRCIDNDMTMEQASQQIGISKATLSRIENKKMPDVDTFFKLCKWLKSDPKKYYKL